ncbi:glucose 1-dehydrogenase [Streptomyces sp. NPDC050625]|uniref:SDR family NAD(P)-dependent oxidoreductase n=1 Tax=Streptomyces sp. NPDC050625 TaxID=3154629 RepID=UPI0034200A57
MSNTLERPLAGKVAVVTGASRGIGQAIAAAYVRAGAKVTIAARTADALAETCELADPTGEQVHTVVADVTDPAAGELILGSTLERFGGVDILVNNAGMHYPTPLLETSAEDWTAIIDLNLIAAVNLTRSIGAELVRRRKGTVINITSAWATRAVPQHTAYVTSKAALAHFTRALAREWARHNVTVNAIAPGYFATEITKEGMADPKTNEVMLSAIPQRRVAEPSELGPLAVFLASDAATYVTGSSFAIDGGMALT